MSYSTGVANATLRVLVCDPDPLARAGVRVLVDPLEFATVAGETTAIEAAVAGNGSAFDVAVISHGTVPPSVASANGDIVLFLDPRDRRALADAISGGVTRLVNRASATSDLDAALRAVLERRPYLSMSLIEPLFALLAAVIPQQRDQVDLARLLSPRELEVLLLIGDGDANVDIAKKLRIRETTVRSHVARILAKLNIATRAEAVLVGYKLRVDTEYLR